MRISYDAGQDVLYIVLGDENHIVHSIDIGAETDGVTADLDAAGHIVAIEILGAGERYGEDHMRTIVVEVPTLARLQA
jgi:uncharacterized protein YuzE